MEACEVICGERRTILRPLDRRSRIRTPGRLKHIEDVTYAALRNIMAHTLDIKRVPEVLEQLLNDDRLTKWERNFCTSIQYQLDEGRNLTDRQLEVLEQIHCRY